MAVAKEITITTDIKALKRKIKKLTDVHVTLENQLSEDEAEELLETIGLLEWMVENARNSD